MSESYTYYFYHHMMETDQLNRVEAAIMNHNWEAFQLAKGIYDSMDYKKMCLGFKDPERVIYFPDHIHHYSSDSSRAETIELTEETFKLITDIDCECG